MPTSHAANLLPFLSFIGKVAPASMLDVGVGNGKMGFLAREALDVMHRPEEWKLTLDGIEVFPAYIRAHQRSYYDTIHIGDAYDVIDTLGSYDLIYMGDALEHFPKERGWAMLDKLALHAGRFLLLAVPLGDQWEQGEVFGNPHEAHRSVWTAEDFAPFVHEQELMDNAANRGVPAYGMFLIRAVDYRHHRLREGAEALAAEGRVEEGLRLLVGADLPPDLGTELTIVDLLLTLGRTGEGVARLRQALGHFPDDPSLPPLLDRLTEALGQG